MQRVLLLLFFAILSYLFFKNENILSLCAGIAIFIFGMLTLGDGFKSFSGGTLEVILRKFTNKTYKSIFFGIVSTTLMQSSTLISVLTISFLGAGLIDLIQGIGIILGSQIGTTTGAWLIAGLGVKASISKFTMPLVVFGVVLMLKKTKKFKGFGSILIGIGFIFLGVDYIQVGFNALGDDFNLAQYSIDGFKGVLIFFIIGVIITIITQSSLATIVLTIAALGADQVTFSNALSIVIGANLGTTFTAVISSLGSNIDGKRVALVYLFFNIFLCIFAIFLLNPLITLVNFEASLLGISQTNYGLKLALFHTTINIISVLALTPFIKNIANFMILKIKKKKSDEDDVVDSIYLNDLAIEHIGTAKELAYKEISNLGVNAAKVMAEGIFIKASDIRSDLTSDEVVALRSSVTDIDYDELYQKKIKLLYGKIINFIILAQSKNEEENESVKDLYELQKMTKYIVEAIKDIKHLQKNLKKYMNSSNQYIKMEYMGIRKNLIEQFRILDKILTVKEVDFIFVLLAQLEIKAERFDKSINKSISELIKAEKITPLMATSLMNDSGYAYNMSEHLIRSTKIYFIQGDQSQKNIRRALLFNKGEIEKLI